MKIFRSWAQPHLSATEPRAWAWRGVFAAFLFLLPAGFFLTGRTHARQNNQQAGARQSQGKKGTVRPTPKPTPTPTSRARVIITHQPVQLGGTPIKRTPVKPAPQADPKDDDDPGEAIRVESHLVTVPVSVTDYTGRPISNLLPADFRLEEEGQVQKIEFLGEPGKTPVDLVILFDVSGSVENRFQFEQQATSRFLRAVLRSGDTTSIFSIGLQPHIIQDRTQDRELAIRGTMSLKPTREGTAVFDTVARAVQYLRETSPGTRRVIVAVSDGEDNSSEKFKLPQTLRELQQTDCLFYAINPSGPSIHLNRISQKGHTDLMSMATLTGGNAFLPDKVEDLEAVFNQIAVELQAQYLIGYYPVEDQRDGKFRRIAVKVPRQPDLRVRARQGYYAPGG
ncbi:MAG: VWA domain-containing protein [Blastocatellia bacterium]